MNESHKKVRRALNYFHHFVFFISAVTSCVSVCAFASLFGATIDIKSSAILNVCRHCSN